MTSKKKEHTNDLRILVIRHYQNADSLSEIAAKPLLFRSIVQYMVDKYKSTKCIGHLFGRARSKRKTGVTTDRLIQRKLELNQQNSVSTVKVEFENERGISSHVDTIRKRAHKVGPVAHKKLDMNKINRGKRFKFGRKMLEKTVDFWKNVVWFESENPIFSAQMIKLWSGEYHVKDSIQNIQFLQSSTVMILS